MAATAMSDDRLAVLEERLAWLQRHVAEQDKAMLAMTEEIDRLKRQAAAHGEKLASEPDAPAEPDARPPHY